MDQGKAFDRIFVLAQIPDSQKARKVFQHALAIALKEAIAAHDSGKKHKRLYRRDVKEQLAPIERTASELHRLLTALRDSKIREGKTAWAMLDAKINGRLNLDELMNTIDMIWKSASHLQSDGTHWKMLKQGQYPKLAHAEVLIGTVFQTTMLLGGKLPISKKDDYVRPGSRLEKVFKVLEAILPERFFEEPVGYNPNLIPLAQRAKKAFTSNIAQSQDRGGNRLKK